ncbi:MULTISPECIES: diaminobutyrate acetyltransferase [unclassified Moorena]|nr:MULTISPECIES: diaminobutyrate acetyltransferase [unclassified Moorena]NEO10453.1 diaminobutyrate acetyltransferase [Moorena sp. SIO3I8]NEO22913.1 diaminobutyrate acetyltransferase [Moorena sp. SIO4A5]NEQ61931.1 diaminobutyrate acetyltransferase [Moorena sp. SIO4A1]
MKADSIITYRHPRLEDGLEVYHLIKKCPPLDVNSQYYYYLICSDFKNTCVVAEYEQKIIGFISGYLKPENSKCLFIWQVAVAEKARGRKVATNMLKWLTKQPNFSDIQSLETTISPANKLSQNLFMGFAEENKANCQTNSFLDVYHFDTESHAPEILYKIFPLKLNKN